MNQSIVYRGLTDIKANLLEVLIINKKIQMPDKNGNKINSEWKLISETGVYPKIGTNLKNIYFDRVYSLKGNKKYAIVYVRNLVEYIEKFTDEDKKDILEALKSIDKNLNEILRSDELKENNVPKAK